MHSLLRNKKIILAILSVFIINLFILLFIFLSSEKKDSQRINNNPLSVTFVTPQNQSRAMSIYEPISITFSRPVSSPEQMHIQLTTHPNILGNYSWSEDNTTLTFLPTSPLWTQNTYTINVNYAQNQLYSWSFSTIDDPQDVPIEDQIKNQAEADKDFGEWVDSIYTNYPWYDKLPLMTDNYFVYFDLDQKKFISKIYTQGQSTPQEEIQKYQGEIISRLESLGIKTAEFQIEWTSEQKM